MSRSTTCAAGRSSSISPTLWPTSTLPWSMSPSNAAIFRLRLAFSAARSCADAPERSAASNSRVKSFLSTRIGSLPRPISVVSAMPAASARSLYARCRLDSAVIRKRVPSCTPSAPRQNMAAMPVPSGAKPPPAVDWDGDRLDHRAHQHQRSDFVGRRVAAGLGADRDHCVDARGLGLARVLGRGGDVQPGHATLLEARDVLLGAALRGD